MAVPEVEPNIQLEKTTMPNYTLVFIVFFLAQKKNHQFYSLNYKHLKI
jgi:hypothetical protein